MFAPEFQHIIQLIEDGLQFKCPQANELKIIYTVYKNKYDIQKAKFKEIKDKSVDELTFT